MVFKIKLTYYVWQEDKHFKRILHNNNNEQLAQIKSNQKLVSSYLA